MVVREFRVVDVGVKAADELVSTDSVSDMIWWARVRYRWIWCERVSMDVVGLSCGEEVEMHGGDLGESCLAEHESSGELHVTEG